MRIKRYSIVMALAMVAAGCSTHTRTDREASNSEVKPEVVYVARLHPLNTKITGMKTTGEARFVVRGDTLEITINVKNAPPNMAHWQHFHGFKDGRAATCPTRSADTNHDGIIDLIETEAISGTTMVPFNADPAAMDVASNTYPRADADGNYHYQKTVSLKALKASFAKAFGGAKLDLSRRVVYIHGVPADTKLPASVKSLDDIPAQVTLPIACGEIHRTLH